SFGSTGTARAARTKDFRIGEWPACPSPWATTDAEEEMILRQLLHHDPVIAVSYLVGCAGKGVAVIVDPVSEPNDYMNLAESFGPTIRFVIDTHLHADHLSTGRELAV